MNRWAVMDGDTVRNVVVADEEYAAEHGLEPAPDAAPGWIRKGGKHVPPPPSEVLPEPTLTRDELLDKIDATTGELAVLRGMLEAAPVARDGTLL